MMTSESLLRLAVPSESWIRLELDYGKLQEFFSQKLVYHPDFFKVIL